MTKSDWKAFVWLYETSRVPREKELLGIAIRLIIRLVKENKRLMKHFELYEFECPCCRKNNMDEIFLEMLDEARDIAQVPFKITSGFRCENHNRAVRGVKNSSHTLGLAADIVVETNHLRLLIISALCKVGFIRIGIAKDFVHVDVDHNKPQETMWLYK